MPICKYIKGNPDYIGANIFSSLPFASLEKKEGSSCSTTFRYFVTPMPVSPVRIIADTRLLGLPINLTTADLFINFSLDLSNYPVEFQYIRTA